jgi:hypothetical protein
MPRTRSSSGQSPAPAELHGGMQRACQSLVGSQVAPKNQYSWKWSEGSGLVRKYPGLDAYWASKSNLLTKVKPVLSHVLKRVAGTGIGRTESVSVKLIAVAETANLRPTQLLSAFEHMQIKGATLNFKALEPLTPDR